MLTWNGAAGVPFEWASLTGPPNKRRSTAGDAAAATACRRPPFNYSRLNYLRGDRSNEQTPTSSTTYVGTFRDRASVLGDIIDSSPTWVGPPNAPYPNTWADRYNTTGDTMAENSGETYANFRLEHRLCKIAPTWSTRAPTMASCTAFDRALSAAPTTYQTPRTTTATKCLPTCPGTSSTAFKPQPCRRRAPCPFITRRTISPIRNTAINSTSTHRREPGICSTAGQWHTWLVGGLGPGGNAIYALDITNPTQFTEANAANTVIGEWSIHQLHHHDLGDHRAASRPTRPRQLRRTSAGTNLSCVN